MKDIGIKNTGVLDHIPLPTDYIAGSESGVVFKENLKSRNWGDHLPSEEKQVGRKIKDSFACVSFSALNSVETQLNFYLQSGALSDNLVVWLKENGYIDKNGKVDLADRFTAKMSGTTKEGNWVGAVWNSIRNHGVVPEWIWPSKIDELSWDEYYAEIPENIRALGQQFTMRFTIQYEWINDIRLVPAHLSHAPIQSSLYICPGYSTDSVVKKCADNGTRHATLLYGVTDKGENMIFDSIAPFTKVMAPDYTIYSFLKGVVTPGVLSFTMPTNFHYVWKDIMNYGDSENPSVVAMQKAFKILGVFPREVQETGNYFNITRLAVLQFQKRYSIASPQEIAFLDGKVVGPKTLKKLNELFA